MFLQVWKPVNINDPEAEWIWELKDEIPCKSLKDAGWKARCYMAIGQGVFKLEIVGAE